MDSLSESTRDTARPFAGPVSVSLAALTLVALAAASFTSALTRQLRLPRPDNTAKVVVMAPKEAPPPGPLGALAYMAPADVPPPPVPATPRRHVRPAPDPLATPSEPLVVARAAPLSAADAAAIAPIAPPPAPEAEPGSPTSP